MNQDPSAASVNTKFVQLTPSEEKALRVFLRDAGSLEGLPRFTYFCAPEGLKEKKYSATTDLAPLFSWGKDDTRPDFYISEYKSGEAGSARHDLSLKVGEFLITFYCSTGFEPMSVTAGITTVTFSVGTPRLKFLEVKCDGVMMS